MEENPRGWSLSSQVGEGSWGAQGEFWLFGSFQPALTSGNNFVQEETSSLRLKRAKQTEAPTLGAGPAELSQACAGETTGLWLFGIPSWPWAQPCSSKGIHCRCADLALISLLIFFFLLHRDSTGDNYYPCFRLCGKCSVKLGLFSGKERPGLFTSCLVQLSLGHFSALPGGNQTPGVAQEQPESSHGLFGHPRLCPHAQAAPGIGLGRQSKV